MPPYLREGQALVSVVDSMAVLSAIRLGRIGFVMLSAIRLERFGLLPFEGLVWCDLVKVTLRRRAFVRFSLVRIALVRVGGLGLMTFPL